MYSAWVAGCEVVLLTKSALRSGPDLLPVLRDAQVTTLFCPPVLLSTLTAQPERDLPYPICRYIVPAGEAFPASLIEPWSRARRQIVNTYGPTEVSTDTSRQLLRPNEPVTIGDHCWIASDVTVLRGVRIGEQSVVGARSLVSKSIPPHSLAIGSPAQAAGKVGDRTTVEI